MLVPTIQHAGTTVRRGDRSNRQSAAGPGGANHMSPTWTQARFARFPAGAIGPRRPVPAYGDSSARISASWGPLPTPQKSVNRTNRAV